MNLESQVCSLELSKKLKELGVKQESAFYWVNGGLISEEDRLGGHYHVEEDEDMLISAFTVAELIEMVEDSQNEWAVGYNDSGCFYHFRKGGRGAGNMIRECEQENSRFDSEETPFVNAIAEWVVHLIDQKLLNKKYLLNQEISNE